MPEPRACLSQDRRMRTAELNPSTCLSAAIASTLFPSIDEMLADLLGAISGGLAMQTVGLGVIGFLATASILGPDEILVSAIAVGAVAGAAWGASRAPYNGL